MPAYGLFSGYYFIFFTALGIISTLFPIYLGDLGLQKDAIGETMAIGMVASVIGPPLWGYISDYMQNRKQIILLCQLGVIAASFMLSCSFWIRLLMLYYFCYNIFQSAIGPLSDSLVLTQPAVRDYGKIRLWGSVGFAVGALLCGQALNTVVSFRVFQVHILFGLLALACTLLLPRPVNRRVSADRVTRGKIISLFRNKQFCMLLVVLLLVNIPYGSYSAFLGLYLSQLGASKLAIGWAWSIAALIEVPVFAIGNKVLHCARAWYLLALSSLVFALRWVAYGLCANPNAILILQLSQGLSFSLFYLVAVQLVNSLAPVELKATGQAIFGSVGFGISFALGYLFGGYYAEAHGYGALFSIAGICAFAGSLTAMGVGFALLRSEAGRKIL